MSPKNNQHKSGKKGSPHKGKKAGGNKRTGKNNAPKVNANKIPFGTRRGDGGSTTSAPPPGQSPAVNMNELFTPIEFDPSWPSSLKEFYSLKSQRIASLTGVKRPTGQNQMTQLIRQAKEGGLLEKNNWSAQLVPILDGCDILQLECLKPNKNGNANSATPTEGYNLSLSTAPSSASAFNTDSSTYQNSTTNENRSNDKKFKKNDRNQNPKGKHNNGQGNRNGHGNGRGKRPLQSNYDSEERKRLRLERFGALVNPVTITSLYTTANAPTGPIVGTCADLEKNYMRLTEEAKPEKVRPEQVLFRSLHYVLENYKQNKDYNYILNQLKSIRQDLVVQNIKSDFTILVYEENARISIQHKDMSDYNQCAAQLKNLYNTKRKQDVSLKNKYFLHELEQMLYRLIYLLATKNTSEINKFHLAFLTDFKHFTMTDLEKIIHEFIIALLKVQNHLLGGEYESFFQLARFIGFKETETGFMFLKNEMLDEIRLRALYSMAYSFASIHLTVIVEKLKFDEGSPRDSAIAGYKYLCSFGLDKVFDKSKNEMKLGSVRSILKARVDKLNKVDIKGQK